MLRDRLMRGQAEFRVPSPPRQASTAPRGNAPLDRSAPAVAVIQENPPPPSPDGAPLRAHDGLLAFAQLTELAVYGAEARALILKAIEALD